MHKGEDRFSFVEAAFQKNVFFCENDILLYHAHELLLCNKRSNIIMIIAKCKIAIRIVK